MSDETAICSCCGKTSADPRGDGWIWDDHFEEWDCHECTVDGQQQIEKLDE